MGRCGFHLENLWKVKYHHSKLLWSFNSVQSVTCCWHRVVWVYSSSTSWISSPHRSSKPYNGKYYSNSESSQTTNTHGTTQNLANSNNGWQGGSYNIVSLYICGINWKSYPVTQHDSTRFNGWLGHGRIGRWSFQKVFQNVPNQWFQTWKNVFIFISCHIAAEYIYFMVICSKVGFL